MQPENNLKKNGWLTASAYFVISAVGLSDSLYITIKYYLNSAVNCSILQGCDKVLTSPYSKIFGVPVALLGVIYYLSVFTIILIYLKNKNKNLITLLLYLTLAGFLASLWFTYLQIFVIKTLCIYCITSALSSTALFVLTLLCKKRQNTI